jgi:hypothetical protein
MKRWWKLGALMGGAAVVAAVLASGLVTVQVGGSGALAADEGDAAGRPVVRPSQVAVAIGQLEEGYGESATVDLRAAIRDGQAGGALRFYSEEYGYYNGAVRTLVVEDGVIKVTGGGGLFPPEGGRLQVRYEAEFSLDGSSASIHVHGIGIDYTMSGAFDGFVTIWEPPAS